MVTKRCGTFLRNYILFIELKVFRYTLKSRPLVVRNASAHWLATSVLDYAWLKREYLRCCASNENAYAETSLRSLPWFESYGLRLETVFVCDFFPELRIHFYTDPDPRICTSD
jgi:hypothetical protein